jgi:hypothetical protein
MQNGKGSKPRITNYRNYYDNFELITFKKDNKSNDEKNKNRKCKSKRH